MYESYDILREQCIGLIPNQEEYINEFSLPWKKKSRWERFKSFVGRNKGKIAAGVAGLGAAGYVYTGKQNFNKLEEKKMKANGFVKIADDDEERKYGQYRKDTHNGNGLMYINTIYNPLRRYSSDDDKISIFGKEYVVKPRDGKTVIQVSRKIPNEI